MCTSAQQTGYDSNQEEWAEEFNELGSEHGIDPEIGIKAALVIDVIICHQYN